MPLQEIRQLSSHTRLGIWRMDEPWEESPRLRERHAVQQLLTAMMDGDTSFTIDHEPSGKPFLNSQSSLLHSQISISHTRGYAVLLLSDGSRVGVDIEYRSDRVDRIASRFIRPDEPAATTDEKLLLWSAKETVYKLFSEDNLAFFDMRALSMGEGIVRIENMRRCEVVAVSCEFTADYVLTYCWHVTSIPTPQLNY